MTDANQKCYIFYPFFANFVTRDKKGYIKYIGENHESLFNMYISPYKLGSATWVLYQNEFDSLSPVQPEIKMPQIKVGLQ